MVRKSKIGEGYLKDGYIIISRRGHPNSDQKNGKIGQHTFIMSQLLNRPLRKTETVHHKNGIRDDNRVENLELWDKKHGPGQRVEDKINWCIQFLNEYGYKVEKI